MSKITTRLLNGIYCCIIMLAAIYCFKRPLYNWDMLPYSYLALTIDHHEPAAAHHLVYESARENLPPKAFMALTDTNNVYRQKMSTDEQAFEEQMPFYAIKPLYTGLVYVFYKTGFALTQSVIVPSVLSYLMIAFLLLYWLRRYLNKPVAWAIAICIMLSSPLIEAAKLATPDCVSALLILSAFYFFLEKPSWLAILLMLTLSIFIRLDNMVAGAILLAALYASKWQQKGSLKFFGLSIAWLVACYFITGLIAHRYGWSVFFYNDFISRLHPAYGSATRFSLAGYFRVMYEHFLSGVNRSSIAIFMALLGFCFTRNSPSKNNGPDRLVAGSIIVIILIRFVLYPDISDRFYIPYYLVIVVLLAKKFGINDREKKLSVQSEQIKELPYGVIH